MTHVLNRIAVERPDEVALQDGRVRLGWAAVNDLLNRATNALMSMVPGETPRLAVFAENSAETLLIHLAALLAGVSSVPVNFHLTAEEVAYILSDSRAQALFVGPETEAIGLEAARLAGLPTSHRLAPRPVGIRSGLAGVAGRGASRRGALRPCPSAQPAVHLGHHRPAQRLRSASHHVRRRLDGGRAPGQPHWQSVCPVWRPLGGRADVPHRSPFGVSPARRRSACRDPRPVRRRCNPGRHRTIPRWRARSWCRPISSGSYNCPRRPAGATTRLA